MPVKLRTLEISKIVLNVSISFFYVYWGTIMEQWIDLLFGNSVGLMSMIVVFGTIAIAAFLVTMLVVKSSEHK